MEDSSLIEQVVIVVKLGEVQNEAKVLQTTSGILSDDLDALLNKAESVELIDGTFSERNLFGFVLPSGASVLGRLTPCIDERGCEIEDPYYFECLIFGWQTFYYGGANPLSILLAALNSLRFSRYRPGGILQRFEFHEQQNFIRMGDLQNYSERIGAHTLAALLESVVENEQTFFVSNETAMFVVSCIFGLLPVYARRALTFATEIKFRDDSSIRLIGCTQKKPKILEALLSEEDFEEKINFLDLRAVKFDPGEYYVSNLWCLFIEGGLVICESFLALFYQKILEDMERYVQNDKSDEPYASFLRLEDLANEWLCDSDFWMFEDDDELGDDAETGERLSETSDNKVWFEDDERNVEDVSEIGLNGLTVDKTNDEQDGNNALSSSEKAWPLKSDSIFDESHLRNIQEECDRVNGALKELASKTSKRSPRVTLSPFSILSAEFSEKNELLRRLDKLVFTVCCGEKLNETVEGLQLCWAEVLKSFSDGCVDRIRDVYEDFLNDIVSPGNEHGTQKQTLMTLGRLEVYKIIRQRKTNDENHG